MQVQACKTRVRASTGWAISRAHVAGGRGQAGLSRATQGRWCPAPGLQTPACGGGVEPQDARSSPGCLPPAPRRKQTPLRSRTPNCLPREAGASLTLVNIFRGKKQKTGMKAEIKVLELVPKAPAGVCSTDSWPGSFSAQTPSLSSDFSSKTTEPRSGTKFVKQ